MQRVGFVLKVKPDMLEEYKEIHRKVWPEMLEALSKAGWRNYSLFMREDGTLFGYVETPSWEEALSKMADTEINARWQTMMAPYFEGIGGKHADEGMLKLEEVFHLD
ncbi:MAG: L-rhamnose mutarotase [Armatimonadetes bacterium]|nr:L-rhamnose mutarotase [Armatimonadota bacterium]